MFLNAICADVRQWICVCRKLPIGSPLAWRPRTKAGLLAAKIEFSGLAEIESLQASIQ